MLKHHIVNKRGTETLLLLHGLFTSAGFWIPYLEILNQFRLVLIDIDYNQCRPLENYVSDVQAILSTESENASQLRGLISHSFGTSIARFLIGKRKLKSFEVCPIYAGNLRTKELSIQNIFSGSKTHANASDALQILMHFESFLKPTYLTNPEEQDRMIYVPRHDDFFEKPSEPNVKLFNGNHFEISEAIGQISRTLMLDH